MNAYELADELQKLDARLHLINLFKSADMLRQQADRIAELEKQGFTFTEDGKFIPPKDYVAQAQTKPEIIWTSCVACGQRVTSDLIHTCSPQTKPLSFDDMVELGKKFDAVWDVNINGSVWFPSVDAFESFCRAIEAKVRGGK